VPGCDRHQVLRYIKKTLHLQCYKGPTHLFPLHYVTTCLAVYRKAYGVDGGIITSHRAAPHSQRTVIAPAPPGIATSAHTPGGGN